MGFTQTGTLASLQSDILDALQNRTDVINTVMDNYAAKTIRELAENYPFDELRTTGPNFVLTTGQAIYPITSFVNSPDIYSMPESFSIYVDFPTNTVVAPVRYKTPAAIEPLIAPATQGIPAWFTRFGSNFHLGPTPNATYTTFLRYQALHPFSNPPADGDPVYMPLTWYDIIAYGAAERIAVVKRWNDQAKYLHDLLWGDPEFQASDGKRGRPGLIAGKLFQQERDEKYNSRNVSIMVPRINPR